MTTLAEVAGRRWQGVVRVRCEFPHRPSFDRRPTSVYGTEHRYLMEEFIVAEHDGIAYRNGSYIPIEELSIGVVEPTFTKSDAVFDVVSVWGRKFFRLDDHLARFRASYEYMRLTPPYSHEEMKRILAECVDRAGLSEAAVWMLCTRGKYAGGTAVGDPRTAQNEFLAYAVPYFWIVPKERAETGIHLWVAETRRAPDVAINQRIKTYNRMDLTIAQMEALDAGADAPVLLSTDGHLTEGTGFNLWIVKDHKILTPRDNLLEGITRMTVLDLCRDAGLDADTVDLDEQDLEDADEAFISSTGGGIIPVTQVNGRPIANGAPGLTTGRLSDLYWGNRAEGWHATSVDDLLAVAAT